MRVYKKVDITYMTVPINKQKPLLSDNFHNSLLINIVIVPKFAILLTGFSPVFQLKDRGIDKVGSRLAFDFPQLVDLVLFIYLLLKLVPSAYRKNLSRKLGTLGMSRYRFGQVSFGETKQQLASRSGWLCRLKFRRFYVRVSPHQ